MNRRSFLACLGLAPVAAAIPELARPAAETIRRVTISGVRGIRLPVIVSTGEVIFTPRQMQDVRIALYPTATITMRDAVERYQTKLDAIVRLMS